MISRRTMLALGACLSLLPVLPACNFLNPASRLYGTWKLDVDATIDRAAAGNELRKSALRAMWAIAGGDVTMELRPDGTGEIKGATAFGVGQESGTWKLVSAESDTLRVELTTSKGTQEHVLRMLDASTFEVDLQGAGGQPLTATFRRETL